MTDKESPYRKAERQFGAGTDALWEYLEAHRREEPSLAIGWALQRAARYLNRDYVTVANHTEVRANDGTLIEEPITKSFISAMLSGRSRVLPGTYVKLARACEVSPLDFFLAEGWLDPADISSYSVPERELAFPILQRLVRLPVEMRPKALSVVITVLESIAALQHQPLTK